MKKKVNKLICILLCILLISLSVVTIFADTINQVTPDTYATIFDTLLQQQSTGTCTNIDDLPQFILDCMPSGYDWNLVSWFNSGYGYYDIGFAVVPNGYYPIQLNAGAIYQTVSMPDLFNTCCFGTYTISTGATSGFSIQEDNNSFIMIYYHNKDNYVHFFKNTQFNMAGQSYEVVVPVIDPVNPSNPNYPSDNPYDPTVPSGWDNYSEMIAGLLYDNFKFTCNNTIYNSAWMPVGEYLMYDFLCKNNPGNETVTFNNWEYNNYIYDILHGEDNNISMISQQLVYFRQDFQDMYDDVHALAEIYASEQEIEAREAAADNQQAVVDNFLDSQGDGSVSASNLGELADSSAEIKSNFNTGYSASGVWDVFDRNWDWFSNTTKNNLEPPAQNIRSVEDYDTPFLDNAINEILRLRGN